MNILLNCIPRSGSHLLMSKLHERCKFGEVTIDNQISQFYYHKVIHNHDEYNSQHLISFQPYTTINLSRDLFDASISLCVVEEKTHEYNRATYTGTNIDPFELSWELIEKVIIRNIVLWNSWQNPNAISLDYDQLFGNLDWLWTRLGLPLTPNPFCIKSRSDISRPSPRKYRELVLNYDELRYQYDKSYYSTFKFNQNSSLAERLGIEPSLPLRVVQISNLLHYHPAPSPNLALEVGIEPTTHGLTDRCSTY